MATAIPENVTETYRKDARLAGTILSKEEREALVKPYLPAAAKASKRKIKPVRSFIKSQIHLLVFNVIHVLFSVYARFRQFFNVVLYRISSILYYHHRTPELIQKDVKGLSRLPKHLSVILELAPDGSRSDGLDTLLDEVAEISAWCASVGIPLLSVYERTGVLKNYIPTTHRTVAAKLHAYFGKRRPSLQVRSPHLPSFLNGDVSEEEPNSTDLGHLSLLLLCAEDGRSTLIDLTKTLAEMSQRNKLAARDISTELVDAEISESVMGEPDLLVLFKPIVKLDGYPPWQLRLTEIFHAQDNSSVEYLVWLKALYRYAKAQMRFGR